MNITYLIQELTQRAIDFDTPNLIELEDIVDILVKEFGKEDIQSELDYWG